MMSMADLSSLDRSAYNALYSWNALNQDNPFEFPRPTKGQLRQIQARLFESAKLKGRPSSVVQSLDEQFHSDPLP